MTKQEAEEKIRELNCQIGKIVKHRVTHAEMQITEFIARPLNPDLTNYEVLCVLEGDEGGVIYNTTKLFITYDINEKN